MSQTTNRRPSAPQDASNQQTNPQEKTTKGSSSSAPRKVKFNVGELDL